MEKIIFPPRPKTSIPPQELSYYEELGIFLGQPKYEGSRFLANISPRGVFFYSRHGRAHQGFTYPRELFEEISALPGLKNGVEYWLDGEILTKTTATDTKNKVVFFDVLHYDNYLFLGPNQVERIKLLSEICGNPTKLDPWRGMGYLVSDNVMMAPTFYSGFEQEFKKDCGDEVEGLVLRKQNSVIDNFGKEEYSVNWLIRCRRPHKNYNF
jgi:ATP-dependent DNA ligase